MRIKTETIVGIFILASIGAFFFLTLHVGALRFDQKKYNSYIAYFQDVSGLTKRADVKMAGVKVGWVEAISLVSSGLVKIDVMILKDHQLRTGAYSVLRQESFLSGKFIEIVPGDPYGTLLTPGSILAEQSNQPASVEDLMDSFKHISENIQSVSSSLKETVGNQEGSAQLKQVLDSFSQAVNSIANVSSNLEHLVSRNEENIIDTLNDLKLLLQDLKERIPDISNNMVGVTDRLNNDLLPQVSGDFNRVSSAIQESLLPQTEKAVSNFNETSGSVKGIADKINKGQGIVGRLVTDEDLCRDVQSTIASARSMFSKIDRLGILVDGHVESLQGPSCGARFEDSKGYFNLRVYPSDDYFYLVGLTFSEKGYITRGIKNTNEKFKYFDEKGNSILPSDQLKRPGTLFLVGEKQGCEKFEIIERDAFRLNLQFGKIYQDIALRAGLFEGAFGVALDYDIPFANPSYKWLMTFEAFDFGARNRFKECGTQVCADCHDEGLFKHFNRPHLKWLNRMFITPNVYFAFGADDFISTNNKNAFFGIGLRFADDDLKYILTRIPG